MKARPWMLVTGVGLLVLVAVFGVLQVLPVVPDPGNPPVSAEPAWDRPETRALAQRACFDCHSHETVTPWYGNVAPLSWLVRSHVAEGRSKLNFSAWDRPQEEADEAGEVVEEGEMPPPYYTLLHPEAALTLEEKAALVQGFAASLRAGTRRSPEEAVDRDDP
jgi:mono/diheme cytochrome c family protein